MLNVGIVGATGYTGMELVRLLAGHPGVHLASVFSRKNAGLFYHDICPQFSSWNPIKLAPFDPHRVEGLDVLFLALPHGQSHAFMPSLLESGLKVIDLSADFRLSDPEVFAKTYGVEHQSPDLLNERVLGFSELVRDQLPQARLCANPGCYATSIVLGLHPLAQAGLIMGTVIADAKSGVSGAGKHLKETSLYCEVADSLSAYGTGVHRHTPEIVEVLKTEVLFSPHLSPMSRGILSTLYVDIPQSLHQDDVVALYKTIYRDCPFVTIAPDLAVPSTKYVTGSNTCMISFKWLPHFKKVVIFSAIDNLIKGASGQAIQNMNMMCGFPQDLGLRQLPYYL